MPGPLRLCLLAAITACAGAAHAQIDLESVELERRVDRVAAGGVDESAGFSVIVRGTGITNAALERPDEEIVILSEAPDDVWSASVDGKQRTQLSMKSGGDDKGVSLKVSQLEVDEEGNVTGGTVSLKAFGQRVEQPLP